MNILHDPTLSCLQATQLKILRIRRHRPQLLPLLHLPLRPQHLAASNVSCIPRGITCCKLSAKSGGQGTQRLGPIRP